MPSAGEKLPVLRFRGEKSHIQLDAVFSNAMKMFLFLAFFDNHIRAKVQAMFISMIQVESDHMRLYIK